MPRQLDDERMDQITKIFRMAAENQEEWERARENPTAYLEARGILLGPAPQVVLIEAADFPVLDPPPLVSNKPCPPGWVLYQHIEGDSGCSKVVIYTETIELPGGGRTETTTTTICVEKGPTFKSTYYCVPPDWWPKTFSVP